MAAPWSGGINVGARGHDFMKNGKMVISVKTRNFSRYRMTKRISLLESSRVI